MDSGGPVKVTPTRFFGYPSSLVGPRPGPVRYILLWTLVGELVALWARGSGDISSIRSGDEAYGLPLGESWNQRLSVTTSRFVYD